MPTKVSQSVASTNCRCHSSTLVTLKVKSYLHHDIHRITLGYFEMIVLRSGMQGKDILEHAKAKYHLCILLVRL